MWSLSAALGLLLFLHGALECRGQCVNMTEFSSRLDTVLAEYDREAPPAAPLSVQLTLELRHASIDERSATASLLGDLRMTWDDDRVNWNSTEWECDSALVAAERLWLPDVALLNAAASGGEAALLARVAADGRVTWHVRLDLAIPVDMQLHDWPYDVQTVVFKFASKAHSISSMDLQLSDDQHAIVFETGAWDLMSVVGFRDKWSRAGEELRLVRWEVSMRRRAGAHAQATGAVLVSVVLLLAAAALLPPADRAGLCAAASFTASLWLVSCVLRLPASRGPPLVVRLAAALGAAGGALAACAALVLRVAACAASPPPQLCTLLSAASTLCRLTPHQEGAGGMSDAPSGAGAWRAAALLLDRALLAVLALVLLVILCCTAAVLM